MKIKKLLKKQKTFAEFVKIGIEINSYSLIEKCQREISKTLNLKNEKFISKDKISLISNDDKKFSVDCRIRDYIDIVFYFLFKDIKLTEYQTEIEKNFIEVHKILPLPETMYVYMAIDKQIEKFLNILK